MIHFLFAAKSAFRVMQHGYLLSHYMPIIYGRAKDMPR